MTGKVLLTSIAVILWFAGCTNQPEFAPGSFTVTIVRSYPHDPQAFTEGLEWHDGGYYEGTGKLGRSSLRRVNLASGRIDQRVDSPAGLYGEGITVFDGQIFQLTWKNKVASVYDQRDLSLVASHPYSREGWGLTHDDKSLIASDGTANLYFLDPATLAEKKRITVHDGGHEIRYLNELEYIDGRVYANIYWSDRIAIIDPGNGLVTGWIDLSNLRTVIGKDDPEMVANGIMYDRQGKRLFVTGKFWPNLFEIGLIPER